MTVLLTPIAVASSSDGSGIVGFVNIWNETSANVYEILDPSNYTYFIATDSGVDALNVTYLGSETVNLIVEYEFIPVIKLTH